MSKRSLVASASGRLIAKKAFQRTGWTQEYLAYQAGLETRQAVWKFFSGRPVDRNVFIDLCFQLQLEWEDIVERPTLEPDIVSNPPTEVVPEVPALQSISEFASLKEKMRGYIERRYGYLQESLEAANALPLEKLYTEVNLLPYLTQQRWLEVSEFSSIDVNLQPLRLNEPSAKATPALSVAQAQTRLVLIGKPGAGKTTFLRHLALQCVNGHFRANCIPIFVSLRAFVSDAFELSNLDLTHYLERCWQKDGFPDQTLESLLRAGQVLVLLDGLDEVGTTELPLLREALQNFADLYYASPLIVTSRIAAVTFTLPGFHYAEVADLTQAQVEVFVERYFRATEPQPQCHHLTRQFLEQLRQGDNTAIRELAATPILLHLLCRVFQDRKMFPTKRAKLYQIGLEILVLRWDEARGIQRRSTAENWSVTDKIKLLSHIATHFFGQEQYFFDKTRVVQVIAQYLQLENIAPADTEQLWFVSEEILKVFEVQHGLLVQRAHNVYSFSHLTFQEYLTARKIAATPAAFLPAMLRRLAQQVNIPHWREVISMTCGLLIEPQLLLIPLLRAIEWPIKEQIEVQTLIDQVQKKAQQTVVQIEPAALKAFYLALSQNWEWQLAIALDNRLARTLPEPLELDLALARLFHQCGRLGDTADYHAILNLYFALNLEPKHTFPEPFRSHWQAQKDQLPSLDLGKDRLLAWWKASGLSWCQAFRQLLATECFGGACPLSPQSLPQLLSYYEGLKFFVNCLQEGALSTELRQELTDQVLKAIQPDVPADPASSHRQNLSIPSPDLLSSNWLRVSSTG